jgi:hypothetical protein
MCTICVPRELDSLSSRQLQDFLELLADVQENLLTLLRGSALASCDIAVSATGNALADCAGPDTDTVEALSDIDYDTHKFPVVLILECLADGRKHHVEPELVDGDAALVLELV